MKFLVWDELNADRECAEEIEAWEARDAAVKYAEDDADGNCDGIYLGSHQTPCADLVAEGQPIIVEDESGLQQRFYVGITDCHPHFESTLHGQLVEKKP